MPIQIRRYCKLFCDLIDEDGGILAIGISEEYAEEAREKDLE